MVTGSRTIRKSFAENFETFEKNLYDNQYLYLLHRYECLNDIYHWPSIKDDGLGFCFHMDYLENLSSIPKYEPQDAHFNSRQLSLHCTVVQAVIDEQIKYAYHISEDKKKDYLFIATVINDLLVTFDDYKKYRLLRFKSDNCSYQYCCKYLFPFYQDLSIRLSKPVICYFGVNGHGRGLVDAMSGFGVKSVVRCAIVTQDFWYETPDDLIPFLRKSKADKDNRYYHCIDKDYLRLNRQPKEDSDILLIKGCLKSRMISFLPDGTHQLKRHICSCEQC